MGLFGKLKNVLFEEEEVEEPVEEVIVDKSSKKDINKDTLNFEDKKGDSEDNVKDTTLVPDHELFKSEKTFDFPDFEEDEFESMKKQDAQPEKPKKSMGINLFDYDKPKTSSFNEVKSRTNDVPVKSSNPAHKFHVSPVISPVYGVLDKNYKKEDIVVVNESQKKSNSVDEVRKKAFGSLDEVNETVEKEIPKRKEVTPVVIEEPKKKEETPDIDELLDESDFDNENTTNIEVSHEEVVTKEEEQVQEEPKKTEEEKIKNDDTLENDLFDLIDSMYENKEDE